MSRISPAALTKEQLVDRWGAARAKAKKLEAEIDPLKEEFERRGLSVIAGRSLGRRPEREHVRLPRREGDPGRDGPGMVGQAGKAADRVFYNFAPREGAVMAAYWLTLAYQSLFEPSASSAGKRTRAPSIAATAPSFWARCGQRTSPARSARGRARSCARSWPWSPTKSGRCPLMKAGPDAAQGQADAGRCLRPSPARLAAQARARRRTLAPPNPSGSPA
jgi:hypothetical protein